MTRTVQLGYPPNVDPPFFATTAGPAVRLDIGPAWFAGATRYHRVRYGWRRPDGRETFGYWCGQHGPTTRAAARPADWRPGLSLCGTCEGRAIGAGYPTSPALAAGADPDPTDLRFDPRNPWAPPALCPGSGRDLVGNVAATAGRCLVCGDPVALRGRRWPGYGYGAVQHPPGPELVPACGSHAWRYLGRSDDGRRAICGACPPKGAAA